MLHQNFSRCPLATAHHNHAFSTKVFFLLIPILFAVALGHAQEVPKTDTMKTGKLDNVDVFGRVVPTSKIKLSPEASSSPASVTLLGRDYISKQVVNSYGDLLRPLAGVSVSNYQLGGVGYGIQMRGYVVTEHARDIAFFIDGVPQNQGSSIEANGYVDLNPLIPENINRLEVIRGPFSPFYGDHALGGAIVFETANKLPNSITVSGGSYGTARAMGTLGFGKNNNTGYAVLDASQTDGYRDNSKEKHINGVGKYTFNTTKGILSVKAQVYSSDFGSAGYLSRASIDSGKLARTAAINSTDGGNTHQQNLVFNFKGNDTSNFLSATAYIQHHDFVRIRTGVVGGPQREERDNRTWAGLDLRQTRITTLGNLPILYALGVYFRADWMDETRFATTNRQQTSQNRDRQIHTYTPAAYAQLQLRPTTKLKLTLSARYDLLLYEIKTGRVDTDDPNVSSTPSTGAFSPKAGIAYELVKGVNMFANVAQGFKAPSGYEENIYNNSLTISRLTSYEVGIGGDDASGRFHGLISAYLSDQTGEIQTDPLGNLTNFGNTRRTGIEAEGRAGLDEKNGFSLFGNYTAVSAKIRNGGPTNLYVTNTPVYAATLGFDYDFGAAKATDNRLVLSIYDQFVGDKNLDGAGTLRSDPYQRFAAKLTFSRRSWANFRAFAESSFYPGNGALNEMSFLSGGSLLTAPQAKTTIRVGVRVPF